MSPRPIDPQGKRALFEAPVDVADDVLLGRNRAEGRGALFSTGPAQAGTVLVECSKCETRTRVSLVDLGLRFLQGSVWLPGRTHNRNLRCPACGKRAWCRVLWRS